MSSSRQRRKIRLRVVTEVESGLGRSKIIVIYLVTWSCVATEGLLRLTIQRVTRFALDTATARQDSAKSESHFRDPAM